MNVVTRPIWRPRPARRAGSPEYLTGFGNGFETEALPGALPVGRNSPQQCPYGLYAEQLSGSPFTAPRTTNERSPGSTASGRPSRIGASSERPISASGAPRPASRSRLPIAPLRWDPIPLPERGALLRRGRAHDHDGRATPAARPAWARMSTSITRSMQDEYFYNADGEMLFVPQQGELRLWTEFGIIDIEPGEIAVIPRGVKIRVELHGRPGARLSVRELRRRLHPARARPDRRQLPGQSARLPDPGRGLRGPRGAGQDVRQVGRHALGRRTIAHSPLDVVAWHGNYAPYKYDLRRYLAGRADPVRPRRPAASSPC